MPAVVHKDNDDVPRVLDGFFLSRSRQFLGYRQGWLWVQSEALSTRQRRQSVGQAGITGGHSAIVLRPHDRKGLPTCQAVSLHATREPGRSPGSDNAHYVTLARRVFPGVRTLAYGQTAIVRGEASDALCCLAQFIAVCRRSKWSRHWTNSPLLALLATTGSKAACKMSSACSNAFC